MKTEQFSNGRKRFSPSKQTKSESLKEPQQHSKPSAREIGEPSVLKASSKLALMQTKEEDSYKETEPMASKRKEKAIESKGEKKTPKKTKSSPAKKEVGTFLKVCIVGLCIDLHSVVFKFFF